MNPVCEYEKFRATNVLIRTIADRLSLFQFNFKSEMELHEGIAQVLSMADIRFDREVHISTHERLDLLTHEGIALEIKVRGSLSDVTRQVYRYAQQPRVRGILVVSSSIRSEPLKFEGKPVEFTTLRGYL